MKWFQDFVPLGLIFCMISYNMPPIIYEFMKKVPVLAPLGSNNVSICASLGTHAYLCIQQKVCWHTSYDEVPSYDQMLFYQMLFKILYFRPILIYNGNAWNSDKMEIALT